MKAKRPGTRTIAAAMTFGLTLAANASDFTWEDNTNSTNWDDVLNWSGPPNEWPGFNDWSDTATIDGTVNLDNVFPILNLNLTGVHDLGALTLVNGGDMSLDTFTVYVRSDGGQSGTTTVSGSGSDLDIQTGFLDTDHLTINSGGDVLISEGGTLQVDNTLDINDGGRIRGNGTVQVASTAGDIVNDGSIQAFGPGSLTFERLPSSTSEFNWDGTGSNGAALTVFSLSKMVIDLPIDAGGGDEFNGTITVNQGAEFQVNHSWGLGGGTIGATDQAVMNLNGGGSGPAMVSGFGVFTVDRSDTEINVTSMFGTPGTAEIRTNMTINDGTISVEPNSTLRLRANLTAHGGATRNNAGTVIYDADAYLNNGHTLISQNNADYIVRESYLWANADDFDMDGFNTGGFSDWELSNAARLYIRGSHLNVTANDFDGDLTFSGHGAKHLDVDFGGNGVPDDTWQLQGPVLVTEGNGFITGPETLDVEAMVTVDPGAIFAVANQTTIFSSAGGITGGGMAIFNRNITIGDDTTISVAQLDADGGDAANITVDTGATLTTSSALTDAFSSALFVPDATLTINSPTWPVDTGRIVLSNNGFGGSTLNGSGVITFGAGASLEVSGTISTLEAETVFQEGSTIALAGGGSELDVNGSLTLDGGDVTEAIANGSLDLDDADVSVTGDSAIMNSTLKWFTANVTIEPGSLLDIDVTDFDAADNQNNAIITLDSGELAVQVGSGTWQMDNTLRLNNTTGTAPRVLGDPIAIGDDIESLDANLYIGGTGLSRISPSLTFYSDADVDIGPDAILQTGSVTFESVNGGEEAEFTGTGEWHMAGFNQVNETTTINMVGGTVELDNAGVSAIVANDTRINAPFTINAATLASYGCRKTAIGTTYSDLTVDNEGVETGKLTVNLDDPNGEWTVRSNGVLRLDNGVGAQTLLDGSDVNLAGTMHVTGDVRSEARVDIGGTVNIASGGSFNPSGGNVTDHVNRLEGGAITGSGQLRLSIGHVLSGFGTVNTDVRFLGSGNRFAASDNALVFNGNFVGTGGTIGTDNGGGILNVTNNWNTSHALYVQLRGGELTGPGIITNDGLMLGHGTVSSAGLVNNTAISAKNGTLILDSPTDVFDLDGASDTGVLNALEGDLEVREGDLTFQGSLNVGAGRTLLVDADYFRVQDTSGPGSIHLAGGTISTTGAFWIFGTFLVDTAPSFLVSHPTNSNRYISLRSGSHTTINTDLTLLPGPDSSIHTGAIVTGTGRLINAPAKWLNIHDTVDVDLELRNEGVLSIAPSSAGNVSANTFVQTATGRVTFEIRGPNLADVDRLSVDTTATLDGMVRPWLSVGPAYEPVLGDTWEIIHAGGGVSGEFDTVIQPTTMPTGLKFIAVYGPTNVLLEVVSSSAYAEWIDSFTSLTNPADKTRTADPDHDGLNNFTEFALDDDPTTSRVSGRIVGKIAPVGGVDAMTLTFPVRTGATPAAGDPPGGPLVLEHATDEVIYGAQAGDLVEMGGVAIFPLTVTEVTGADATAIQAGLPPLSSPDWEYRTFRSPGPVLGDPGEFMRVQINEL